MFLISASSKAGQADGVLLYVMEIACYGFKLDYNTIHSIMTACE